MSDKSNEAAAALSHLAQIQGGSVDPHQLLGRKVARLEAVEGALQMAIAELARWAELGMDFEQVKALVAAKTDPAAHQNGHSRK